LNFNKTKTTIKSILADLRQAKRTREIKKSAKSITKSKLADSLLKLGLQKGDCVLLHSSLKSIGYIEGGAKAVLQAFLDVVTPEGTLIVPTYSMRGTMLETCKAADYIFDPRTSLTQLGSIPANFLKMKDLNRSIHPTHSVSAIGKDAEYITEAHHLASSTYGVDSPWDRLIKINGKIIGLGVTVWPVPLCHVLEDTELSNFPLPVRMDKTYSLKCKNWDGGILTVPVTPLDPKYTKVRIDHPSRQDLRDYFWRDFVQSETVNVGKTGQTESWIAGARDFYDHLVYLMKEGITIYSSADDLKNRPLSEKISK